MNVSFRSFLFVAALAACSVIGVAWLGARQMSMRFLESGYPIWVAKQGILRDCSFGSVLVLGDSRSEAAIIPRDLPLPSANVSLGGTSPVETYFFARRALECPKPPRLVIYAHSMPSYVRPSEMLWINAARYGYIGFRDLRQIADSATRSHDVLFVNLNTHDGLTAIVRDAVYSIGFPSIFVASLVEARGNGRYASNVALEQKTASSMGHVIYKQPAEKRLVGADADVKAFVPSPLETDYFDKTLAMFAAAHVKVMLLTIPSAESTMKAIPPALIAAFDQFLLEQSARYSNIDARTSALLPWPDNLFVDGGHMNEAGAKAFTARLAACLRQPLDRPITCPLAWQ